MKVSAKTLHIVIFIFNAVFAVTWAASLPSGTIATKVNNAVPIKDTLCSENATLNITEVCPTILVTTIDSSDSTLKDFANLCDHAAYLVHKLCEYSQSDSKLGKDIAANVTTHFSQKVTDKAKAGQICTSLIQKGSALKYKIRFRSCAENCLLENDAIKPLCSFMEWSWKFLLENNKGPQERGNILNPEDSKPEKTSELNQVTEKPSRSKLDAVSQEPQERGQPVAEQPEQPKSENSEPPKSEKPVEVTKEQEVKTSPPKDSLLDAGTDDDQKGKPSAKETPPSEVSDPINSQLNKPADQVYGGNLDIVKPPPESLAGKGPTSIPDEDGKTNVELTRTENDDDIPPEAENAGIGEDVSLQKQPSPDQKNEKESKADIFDEDGADNPMGDDETDMKKEPKLPEPNVQSKEIMTGTMDEYSEAEDSHFFVFFFIATFICILFYLIYQNKRKIIAMALEGKKGRHTGRRRPTSASYQKLDNKLDEVMASSPPPSKTHVIY